MENEKTNYDRVVPDHLPDFLLALPNTDTIKFDWIKITEEIISHLGAPGSSIEVYPNTLEAAEWMLSYVREWLEDNGFEEDTWEIRQEDSVWRLYHVI